MHRRLILSFLLSLGAVAALAQTVTPDGGQCPPGKSPLCLCACVEPAPRTCETLPPGLPPAPAIRQRLVRYLFTEAPESLKPLVGAAAVWDDPATHDGFARALIMARCHSNGAAGPVNPAAVPADEVKAWVQAVLEGGDTPQRALRPLVDALPASVVRIAYLRAVELKRGLDYGTFK